MAYLIESVVKILGIYFYNNYRDKKRTDSSNKLEEYENCLKVVNLNNNILNLQMSCQQPFSNSSIEDNNQIKHHSSSLSKRDKKPTS